MIEVRLNKADVLERITKILNKHSYTYNIIFIKSNNPKYQINVKTEKDEFKIDVYMKINGKKSISIINKEYEFLFSEFNFLKIKNNNLSKIIKISKEKAEEKLILLQEKGIIDTIPEFSDCIKVRDSFDKTVITLTFYEEKIRLQGSDDNFFHLFVEFLEKNNKKIFEYFEKNNLLLKTLLKSIENEKWEKFTSKIELSQEQLSIIEAQEDIVVVNACAGSGKTTVLEGLINKYCNSRILYIVYNKAIQLELKKRFQYYKNVKIVTSHGMAYKKYSTKYCTTEFDLFEISEKLNLSFLDAKFIIEIFQKYIIDAEKNLDNFLNVYKDDIKYLYYLIQFKYYVKNYKNELNKLKDEKGYVKKELFFEKIKQIAELQRIDEIYSSVNKRIKPLLEKFMNLIDTKELKEPHDYYLKKFQLKEETTDKYDIIMLDEAQDANGVLIDIFINKFLRVKRFIVGDTYQQIYSWRGAKNSLDYFASLKGAKKYQLTYSYRIGKDLGNFCTKLTELKDNIGLNIKGKNQNQKIIEFKEFLSENTENITILFRKNINMLKYALRTEKKVFFLKNLNLENFKDFLKFKNGKTNEITNFMYLKKYKNYENLEKFIEKELEINSEILIYRDLTKIYPENLEELLNNLQNRIIKKEEIDFSNEENIIFLGTIHSSKGNEFKKLIIYTDALENITSDFLNIDQLKEELNLFYVALIRSKGTLFSQYNLNNNLIRALASIMGTNVFQLHNFLRIENIKKIIIDRKIKHIFHFTSISNVKNILENGLLSRRKLENKNIYYISSDEERLDNKYDYISTSISFPNYKMFYKKRMENTKNIYVLLSLKPNILWEKECLFMPTNAASYKEITENFSNETALNNMFNLDSNKYLNHPKDVQAEVLVKDEIEKEYIQAIYFEKLEHKQEFHKRVTNKKIENIEYEVSKEYFNKRNF